MSERLKVLWVLERGGWRVAVIEHNFTIQRCHNKAGQPKWDSVCWYGTIEQCAQGLLRHLTLAWADLPKGMRDAVDEARRAAHMIREVLKPLDHIKPDPSTAPEIAQEGP